MAKLHLYRFRFQQIADFEQQERWVYDFGRQYEVFGRPYSLGDFNWEIPKQTVRELLARFEAHEVDTASGQYLGFFSLTGWVEALLAEVLLREDGEKYVYSLERGVIAFVARALGEQQVIIPRDDIVEQCSSEETVGVSFYRFRSKLEAEHLPDHQWNTYRGRWAYAWSFGRIDDPEYPGLVYASGDGLTLVYTGITSKRHEVESLGVVALPKLFMELGKRIVGGSGAFYEKILEPLMDEYLNLFMRLRGESTWLKAYPAGILERES